MGERPFGLGELIDSHGFVRSRANQLHPLDDHAILVGPTGGAEQYGRARRLGVHDELATAFAVGLQHRREIHHTNLGRAFDGERDGFGSAVVREHGLALDDLELLAAQGLDAAVERTVGHRLLDDAVEDRRELREEDVLHVDPQREHPIEELRDGRHLVLHATVGIEQRQARHLLELVEAASVDAARQHPGEEPPKRSACPGGFEVVGRLEHALPARLPRTPRDRAEGVEAARDRGDEPLLALHVRRDEHEERGLSLVRAVGASEPLDRVVGLPTGLEQVVDALALVPRVQVRVVTATGAACVREDQDALVVVHEGGGLAVVRRTGTALDREPNIVLLHHAARAARDLGDLIGPKVPDELVHRAVHGGQRT